MFYNKIDIRILLKLLWNKLQYLCSSKYKLVKTASATATHTTNCSVRLFMCTSNQRLYFEFWVSPLLFCLWLDDINSRFKCHLDNKSNERFYNQIVPMSKFRETKTVDKDILITYRFSDRKFPWPIITTSDHLQRTRNLKQFCQFLFSQTIDKCYVNKKLE